ncbi:molybdopterin-dependent oxidoreductase [Nocardia jejuensis]|uniref:molybdopterin-dependent oxidoreductase n=1 Tax=Nocardia jejuensis TaxID=328049 RepID=UPI0008346C55|nr:molybdopterin-dependent oxidoreductase [Nocardia jejuensis]
MTGRGLRAASGIAAAAVVLGVAEIVSVPISPDSTPLQAFGAWVVDHTPDGFREWVIGLVGTNDKLLLFVSMGIVAALLAALAGLIERERRPLGSVLFGVFGLLAVIAAVTRPHAAWTWAFPALLGAWAGIALLRNLIRRVTALEEAARAAATPADSAAPQSAASVEADRLAGIEPGAAPDPKAAAAQAERLADVAVERRQVVRGIVTAGAVAAGAGLVGRWFGLRSRDVSGERAEVQLPPPSGPPLAVEPGADLQIPGLSAYLTPNADFYRIDTALTVPQVSRENWSLRIHGMVDREIRLSYADLAQRAPVEKLVTLTCVSNPVGGDLIGNARWLGYRLDELLAEAGPHPDADMVLSRSIDGFTAGSPLAALTDGRDALLAVGMNGEPLPTAHGYPVRMVVPGLYGYVSATKWVTDLEVTRFDRAQAYWTKRGWSEQGPIKTGCRIDTPRGHSTLKPGRITVAGVAWAQHRGIQGVQVRIDQGEWQPARLAAEPSADTWRQWVFDWDASGSGIHTVWARATDGAGETQTAERADVVPDGASGYPSLTIRID